MFNLTSFTDYNKVYFVTTFLFCVGVLISSGEYLAIRKEFTEEGVYSWRIFSSRPSYLNSGFGLQKMGSLFRYRSVVSIHATRIICCVALPFIDELFPKALLISVVTLSSLILSFRNIAGNDGSDQMSSIICIALFVAYVSADPFIMRVALIFIASQSVLAYVVAGVAKMLSPKWRKGLAVYQIMNTQTYGHERVAQYLAKAPKASNYLLCWSVMLFESLFFLVLFIPAPYCLVFLIWGIAFHIYNAATMGLNNFLWPFVATYPAIVFLNELITKSMMAYAIKEFSGLVSLR